MLKGVKKGIKKKIKGKKDKKEDDLFDPDQLEKYKRELEEAKKARQQDDESSGAAGSSGGGGGHEEDEEWLRFKQLTSGVDVLVNKTKEDLGRIKESSFFQRDKPSEQNKIFAGARPANAIIPSPERENAAGGFNKGEGEDLENGDEQAVPAEDGVVENEANEDPLKVPDSPDIVPVELDDSLFDTTFVDAVATGDIKLTYIPDSPTEEEGDDPFDTSAVSDICKKIEEEERKAMRQVNLGGAVDVLTGKGDKTGIARPRVKPGEMKAKARPRPHAINLLGDFEDGMVPTAPVTDTSKNSKGGKDDKSKDIFDQILDTPSKETVSPTLLEKIEILPSKEVKESSEKKETENLVKNVVDEFDIISQLDPICGGGEAEPLPSGVPSSIPSSIAALLTTTAPADPEEDELDDEFAALAAESIHKGPQPEEVPEEEEEDPFDTSFVDTSAAHGKCELKIIENEFLGEVQSSDKEAKSGEGKTGEDDDDDFDFNPRMGESPPKTLQIQNAPKINPLEDMSPISVKAPTIEPHVKSAGPTLVETTDGKEGENEPGPEEDIDPFDTTRLEAALPGRAELKLLEEELLSSVEQGALEPAKLPEKIANAIIKSQQTVEEEEFDFDPRKGEVKDHPLDTHDASHQTFDTVSKVLTPQQEEADVEIDPFDTSSALGLIPGPLELKLLEDELVSPTVDAPTVVPTVPSVARAKFPNTFNDDDDFDFDPREGKPAPAVPTKPPPTTEDIFDSAMDFAVDKPLTPQLEAAPVAAPEPKLCPTNVDDPFDTSGIEIENYLAKSELRQMEEELLNAPAEPQRKLPVVVAVEYKKPPQPVAAEPPPPPPPAVPHLLEAMTPTDDSIKPLTPVELMPAMSGVISVFDPSPMADPFDTTIAEGVIPGKTEIKFLEKELGVEVGGQRRLSDPDFDPRVPNHPAANMISQPLTPLPIQPMLKPVSQTTPAQPSEPDPFDTSTTDVVMPGKAELKALEAELL